jgi:hypothetical protein
MLPGDYVESAWPSQAAVDIEMITWYERYVICAPSMHKTGKVYRWYRDRISSRGISVEREMNRIPSHQHAAALPIEWCEYLAGLAGDGGAKWSERRFDGSARQWLIDYGGGEPCRYVESVGVRQLEAVRDGGSVHESSKLAVAQLVKAAAEGHVGINSALAPLRELFIYLLGQRGGGERRRGENKAVSEWRAMVSGAVAKYGGEVMKTDEICDELEGF